jgi:hypothetical protein
MNESIVTRSSRAMPCGARRADRSGRSGEWGRTGTSDERDASGGSERSVEVGRRVRPAVAADAMRARDDGEWCVRWLIAARDRGRGLTRERRSSMDAPG